MIKKRLFFYPILALIVGYMIFSGYMKVQSYVIGLYTAFDISEWDVHEMQRFWRDYHDRYDTLTAYQRRELDKRRLEYEIKVLNALEPFVQKLNQGNQFGK